VKFSIRRLLTLLSLLSISLSAVAEPAQKELQGNTGELQDALKNFGDISKQ
jgi:hypothetical protein